jgi:uncharacterized RDD family membrane protein YckC
MVFAAEGIPGRDSWQQVSTPTLAGSAMSDYHLTIADKQTGPHSQFYIIQGIREGRLRGTELVWRMGLEGWQPLRELEDFSSYWPPTPEMLAKAESAKELARTALDQPRPWLRFWARWIDLLWFYFGLSSIFIVLAPEAFANAYVTATRWFIPVNSLLLLVYLPMEAWMLSRYGTTPGKSLLRIQVRTLSGSLPTFQQALRRTFFMMLKGLAFMLFPFYFFTMVWWKVKLRHTTATSWDETAELRVEHGEPESWRYMIIIGVVLGIFLAFAVATQPYLPRVEEILRNSLSQ